MAAISAACASTEARQVKTYDAELQGMLGRNEADVTALIAKSWQFGLLDRWSGDNPSVEAVLKNNFRRLGFTKSEAGRIFAEPGAYRVLLYTKPLAREEVRTGQIDSLGGGIIGTEDRHQEVTNGFIRIVFKDGKLVHVRVST